MNHDTRRLVDDQQVLVLPGDRQADRLGLVNRLRLHLRKFHFDLRSGGKPVALRTRYTVHEHGAVRDQPLRSGTRADVRLLREVAVQSLPFGLGGYAESDQERSVDAP
jgi:hypothetical protein